MVKFPNGYTPDQPPPNFHIDEHFQNWMRTAGLPTFTKLYGRNDNDELVKGRYEITINMSKSLWDRQSPLAHIFTAFNRLPCQDVLWHKVDCDINRVVDWR